MSADERTCLVVNPRSAGGRTGARIQELCRAAERYLTAWEIRETEEPRHAEILAEDAVREGFRLVVAVGGDGTANEVVNGILRAGAPPESVSFSIVPAGTGSDLVKSLGIPTDLSEAVHAVARGEDRLTDVLDMTIQSAEGEVNRKGLNVSGIGMAGDVVMHANRSAKRFGGMVTFLTSTVRTAVSYRPPRVRLSWTGPDGDGSWEGSLSNAFVANGHYCGGGMWVGRGGRMDDGVAELTVIPDLPKRDMIRHGRRLYSGTIGDVSEVVTAKIWRIEAFSLDRSTVRADLDGEQPGYLPLKISVQGKALLVRSLWA